MKSGFAKSALFLLGVLVVALLLAPFLKFSEGFRLRGPVDLLPGDYPNAVDKPLLGDMFTLTGNTNVLEGGNANSMWKSNPVGNFNQTTNNPKYPDSPDNGSCTPAMFCDVFYNKELNDIKENQEKNIITPLKVAEEGEGARINYYRTMPNKLIFSIPTNENILY
jgi:hypothetical protein